ncbi:MAG: hypothetical protein FJZ00_01120 [Candidatus Sericytochromatia bacterium]|uniref:beta-N-acetylhexosaminidase n=1 Tax=Candidatus Tanganyikabacteria bacterium TaxID=2961651 RepID=A0A938BLY1_9BACT|nr:hypothetical protein [Candidatus Tanganyikabacteria bacterium]
MPSIRQLAGRLICPVLPGVPASEAPRLVSDLESHGWGGYIVFRGRPDLPDLLTSLQSASPHPLLIAADIEWGAGQQIAGATFLPCLMAIGAARDEDLAYEAGRITAIEARAAGVNWAFAPVADVNVNPRNPIINIRSFGEDPESVARLAAAWVRGAQDHGLMATAKHFPGHGDTAVDSHSRLPTIAADRQRIDRVELAPFRACVEAGVGSIMTAHLAVPALDPSGLPATLSEPIMTGVLRRELGFGGLLVTDALIMGGITASWTEEDAVAAALNAGCDMLLMPRDAAAAHEAVQAAIESGKVPLARVEEAIARIDQALARLGLDTDRLPRGPAGVDYGANQAFARELAGKAVTLVRDPGVLPLGSQDFAVIIDDDGDLDYDHVLPRDLDRRGVGWGIVRAGMDQAERAAVLDRARGSRAVLVPIFSQIKAWKDRSDLPEELAEVVRQLSREFSKAVVVTFANPYLLQQFPDVAGYACAYGGLDDQQLAALAALFGEAGFPGSLPVTIEPATTTA